MFRDLLTGNLPDCDLLAVGSAAEALALLPQAAPDVALIDVEMPEMDGIALCRRLKADEATAHFPVILITGHETTGVLRAEGLSAGADDFIAKPVITEEFIARMKVMLRIKRAEDDLRTANVRLEDEEAERTEELLDYQKQLQRLALQLSSAEDRERRRVAEGLHDEVSQSLGALSLHLQVLNRASLSQPQKEALSQSRDLLHEMSRSVRTLTFELCPPMLYETGLASALVWLVEQSRQRFEGRLNFECGPRIPSLREEVRAFAFRAARELLINVLKHASAQDIHLRLTAAGAHVEISVEDDGVGFDPEAIGLGGPGQVAFGLFAVRERARGLGGHLEIDAAAGRGSKLTLVLPAGA